MRLHSRWGSIVLGVVGAVYVIAALGLLSISIPWIGEFAGKKDYLVFMAVSGAAAIGMWFVVIALTSLHVHLREHLPHFRRAASGGHPGATLQ